MKKVILRSNNGVAKIWDNKFKLKYLRTNIFQGAKKNSCSAEYGTPMP